MAIFRTIYSKRGLVLMEQAGLVTRRRGQVDERQVQVHLTDAGRALLERSNCLGETLIERSGMTGAEVEALNQQVRRLREALAAEPSVRG